MDILEGDKRIGIWSTKRQNLAEPKNKKQAKHSMPMVPMVKGASILRHSDSCAVVTIFFSPAYILNKANRVTVKAMTRNVRWHQVVMVEVHQLPNMLMHVSITTITVVVLRMLFWEKELSTAAILNLQIWLTLRISKNLTRMEIISKFMQGNLVEEEIVQEKRLPAGHIKEFGILVAVESMTLQVTLVINFSTARRLVNDICWTRWMKFIQGQEWGCIHEHTSRRNTLARCWCLDERSLPTRNMEKRGRSGIRDCRSRRNRKKEINCKLGGLENNRIGIRKLDRKTRITEFQTRLTEIKLPLYWITRLHWFWPQIWRQTWKMDTDDNEKESTKRMYGRGSVPLQGMTCNRLQRLNGRLCFMANALEVNWFTQQQQDSCLEKLPLRCCYLRRRDIQMSLFLDGFLLNALRCM